MPGLLEGMPGHFMTSWLPFSPKTKEVQSLDCARDGELAEPFDEKWAFVGKKEKHCRSDPNDSDR